MTGRKTWKKLRYGKTNSWDKLEFKTRLRLELLGDKTRDFLGLNLNIVCWVSTINSLHFVSRDAIWIDR